MDLDGRVVRADDTCQQSRQRSGQLAVVSRGLGGAGARRRVDSRGRKDVAVVVDDRDVVRVKARHRGRDQVDYPLDLAAGELGPVSEVDEDRGGRGLGARDGEAARSGHHQGHLCVRDALDRLDGRGELSLECFLVVDVLHELGRGDPRRGEGLERDGPARGKPCLGEADPFLVHVGLRDENGRPVVLQLVGNVVRGELLGDLAGLGGLQVRVKDRIARS